MHKIHIFVYHKARLPIPVVTWCHNGVLIIGISVFFSYLHWTHTQVISGMEPVTQVGCTSSVLVHITRIIDPSLTSHSVIIMYFNHRHSKKKENNDEQ